MLELNDRCSQSFAKSNVSRIHVHQEDAVPSERAHDGLDLAPPRFELLPLLRSPLLPHLLRIVRRFIQVSTRKVQYKWLSDDRHFNHLQRVVIIEEFWNLETSHVQNSFSLQPQIDVPFSQVGPLMLVNFDRGLAICGENDTMDAETKLVLDRNPFASSISFGAAQKFVASFLHGTLQRQKWLLR